MTIGEKLVKLRGDKTQQQVADDLGISASAVSAYETNVRVPRDKLKREIAAYFDTTVQALFF